MTLAALKITIIISTEYDWIEGVQSIISKSLESKELDVILNYSLWGTSEAFGEK